MKRKFSPDKSLNHLITTSPQTTTLPITCTPHTQQTQKKQTHTNKNTSKENHRKQTKLVLTQTSTHSTTTQQQHGARTTCTQRPLLRACLGCCHGARVETARQRHIATGANNNTPEAAGGATTNGCRCSLRGRPCLQRAALLLVRAIL